MMMMMMIDEDEWCAFRHSTFCNPSTIQARSNVRVAPNSCKLWLASQNANGKDSAHCSASPPGQFFWIVWKSHLQKCDDPWLLKSRGCLDTVQSAMSSRTVSSGNPRRPFNNTWLAPSLRCLSESLGSVSGPPPFVKRAAGSVVKSGGFQEFGSDHVGKKRVHWVNHPGPINIWTITMLNLSLPY